MKATNVFKIIALSVAICVSGISVYAQGNARKDKDNKGKHSKDYVAPPSKHKNDRHDRDDRDDHRGRVPHGSKAIKHNNRDYYWHNGNCYYNNSIVRPPYGMIVPTLPSSYSRVRHNGRDYYRYGGDYYVKYNNSYRVVEPIVGMIVNSLIKGHTVVRHKGKDYYKSNGVYYIAVKDRNNRTTYRVIGSRLP